MIRKVDLLSIYLFLSIDTTLNLNLPPPSDCSSFKKNNYNQKSLWPLMKENESFNFYTTNKLLTVFQTNNN